MAPPRHLLQPGRCVAISAYRFREHTVSCRGGRVEQDDDRIAVGTEAPDRGDQRLRHAGIERADHLVDKLLLAVISLRQG